MNIFCDRHHSGLAHSLHLLFEKRLNCALFFPLGLWWAEQGWWKLHEPYNYNIDTAKQYLQIKPEYKPMDGTVPLNRVVKEFPTHYEVEDLAFGYIQKCITFDQFKEMDIDIDKSRQIIKVSQEPTSLEMRVGDDEDSQLGDFIEDENSPSPYEEASRKLLKEHMDEVLGSLSDREKKVLILRFGLQDGRQRTLEEVGREFSVTRERIRQIEAKALRKLRHPTRAKKLRDYLE